MSPDIIGFVTRDDAGLVKPRSISRSITPEHGGVAVHWGGSGNPPSSHDGCLALWKRWQDFHMSDGWAGLPNGGSDIAYTGGYCNHGYAFAGRGIGVRSGAQGTKVGNDHYYSFVWLGGSGGRPNSLAYSALGWWIIQARAAGAGDEVRPHSWFKSTGCPGPDLRDFASDHHNKPLLEDDMVDRKTAVDPNPALAENVRRMVDAGVFSEHTQPGGVTFNDELATFLERAGVLEVGRLKQRIANLEAKIDSLTGAGTGVHNHDGRYLKNVTVER